MILNAAHSELAAAFLGGRIVELRPRGGQQAVPVRVDLIGLPALRQLMLECINNAFNSISLCPRLLSPELVQRLFVWPEITG